MDTLSGFVLAGGRSTRMGQDKAFLRLDGVTMLERTLVLLRSVAKHVWISGATSKFSSFAPVIEDVYPGHGPLGGIHAALRATATDLNLMVAVDLPLIDVRLLRYLVTTAEECDAVVTACEANGGIHPLCAVYRREFAELAERAIMLGQNKIDALFSQTRTRIVSEAELSESGFSAKMFLNLNSPNDLRSLAD
ncbi:MAG TPA: molybdenum cofactor guanylyltransferase [Terriglobales bacterium]|jgi:molybdopterin-guanine dinucleotide biosynthesis protein A